MVAWRSVLPVVVVWILIVYEEKASTPSCQVVVHGTNLEQDFVQDDAEEDLKVMLVANLLLLGSEAGYANIYFRDYYLSKFFRKSVESLNPDMLLVLGDISAKGYELTKSKWSSVLQQFHGMLGPFIGLPFHAILGDRDVGECSYLNENSVNWIASKFPGLDSAGCGAFEINNISFVSLNAVALLCGNNDLRFRVEKVIERESIDMQMEIEGIGEAINQSSKVKEDFDDFEWRENAISPGSGPVLLLHFPLHQTANSDCIGSATKKVYIPAVGSSKTIVSSGLVGAEPYELLHTVPLNATNYIFQAIRPRIVFSAHTHEFCIHTHSDGTPEVTVPSMTWNVRDDPGFVIATFRRNNRVVTVSYCSLARESHMLIAYISALLVLMSLVFVPHTLPHTSLR